MAMDVGVRSGIERVVEVKLRAPRFVIANERHGLSDHRGNCTLVFLGQSLQQAGRECEKNDLLTDVRVPAFSRHQ